jgi:hypothetical protein
MTTNVKNTFFLILYEMGQEAHDAASWASPKRSFAPQNTGFSRMGRSNMNSHIFLLYSK